VILSLPPYRTCADCLTCVSCGLWQLWLLYLLHDGHSNTVAFVSLLEARGSLWKGISAAPSFCGGGSTALPRCLSGSLQITPLKAHGVEVAVVRRLFPVEVEVTP
jgi:hypothetical protein